MSKRGAWEFNYTVKDLRAATERKLTYFAGRLNWWEDKKSEVLAQIKAEGIEIEESVSNKTSNSYRSETIHIRNDLRMDMDECIQKVRHHRGNVEMYTAWKLILQAQKDQDTLALDHADWLFFFSPPEHLRSEENLV